MRKKRKIPKFQPDQSEFVREAAEKLISLIEQDYEISALDFLRIMERTEEEGLKRFKL